jgi:transposase
VTTKLHLTTTAEGHVVEAFLTAGNVADISVANLLYDNVFECYVLADKGYDSDAHRAYLRSQNNVPVIPGRCNRKEVIIYNKIMYKLRKNIEIFFGKLKENKRLSMRFEKDDRSFMSMIAIAAIKIFAKQIIS